MAASPGPTLLVFLFVCFGLLNSSTLDSCPEFCTCDQPLHLNCSSAGLALAPRNIHSLVSELDLSNNRLEALTFESKYYDLHKVWLGNNSFTHLSLCVELDLTSQLRSRVRRRLGSWKRRGCLLWASTLQLLSAERNQLETLPEGLGQQRALQILNLSFNKISKLEPDDFTHLRQLEELHLQYNHISIIHPEIFQRLDMLKVLDLSFNLLTTLHPSTYISLRAIGTDVSLEGNSWICDCSMHYFKKDMIINRNKGFKLWSIECTSPLAHAGMNLMDLEDDDFKCPDSHDSGLHKEITVHRGSEILLTCSEPDALWWTPNGQTTGSQENGGLLIRHIANQDEGLYACMSQSHEILTIFNVQMSETIRKSRSVLEETRLSLDKMVQTRNTVTQSRFDLAVSLSVIITFIVAFILGVILQPYLCICWQKITTKKPKSQTATSVPNAQQEQYHNEAYLHCEDVDDFEPHRERRVTFTEYTEEGNMQYYDTVARDAQEGNGGVIGPGPASSHSSDDSGSEGGKRKNEKVNNLGKKMEFEHIPDSLERKSLSSQSSNSSLEDNISKKKCSTPNESQTIKEQVQKTAEVPQISVEITNEIPGFSSEPFADWSPHQHGSSIMDPELDNGDQFEFSDSVRSGKSSFNDSFNRPNLVVPNVNHNLTSKSSSSSSEMSDDEPTQYTVNADTDEEAQAVYQNVATKKASQMVTSSSSSSDSETESRRVVETQPAVDNEHIPAIKSSEDILVKSELQKKEQVLPIIEQKPPTPKKRRAPQPPPRKPSSSSSSDSEDEMQKLKQDNLQLVIRPEPENLNYVQKRKAPLPPPRKPSSSSSDSEDEMMKSKQESLKLVTKQETKPVYHVEESSIATSNVKPQSDTSSSSESEWEQENYYENTQDVTSPAVGLEQESQWPVINLIKIPKVKRRLDIKTADNEDEHLYVSVTQVQEKVPVGVIIVPKTESGTSSSSESEEEQENYYENFQDVTSPVVGLEQESLWPVVNLLKIPKVKRRLEFKTAVPRRDSEGEHLFVNVAQEHEKVPLGVIIVPKTESGTSSSSESEEEQENYYENIQELTSPKLPPVVGLEQESFWPVINLLKIPKVKRCLDIKTAVPRRDNEDERLFVNVAQEREKVPVGVIIVPKAESETSTSSSESEEEQENYYENIQEVTSPKLPPVVELEQESYWPVINLLKIPKVKRRLDIKTAVPRRDNEDEHLFVNVTQEQEKVPLGVIIVPKTESGTSSSSESEEEQENYYENIHEMTSPVVGLKEESHWPVINLTKIPKVKKRLDIKTFVPEVDISSSSDSEDEHLNVKVTQVPEKVPATSIKVPKPDSGTSSSSESEDEKLVKIHQENLQQTTSPIKPPIGVKPDQESQWPVIDLIRIQKVKRRLDIKERANIKLSPVPERIPSTSIKGQKSESGTSSSSESEDELEIKGNANQQILQPVISPINPPILVKQEQESQWPVIDLVKIPKVKQRLDIKTTKSTSESSSSDSEDERVTKVQGKLPSTPVNVLKPDSGTSSSSESEDEQEIQIVNKDNVQQIVHPTKQPSSESPWPVIDLGKIPKIKQRLDVKEKETIKIAERAPSVSIKAPKPDSGTSSSSSSSDSEDEQQSKVKVNQESLQQTTSPIKPPIAVKPHQDSHWPMIDLVRIPKVKRRVDIKERVNVMILPVPERVPSLSIKVPKSESGTSASSESEDEQESKVNRDQQILQPTISTNKPATAVKPDQESYWPRIDLVKVPKVKQRLEFKTTKSTYESSSSDSEDERVKVNVTHVQGKLPSTSVKVLKPDSGTSSSSESEDEQDIHIVKKDSLHQISHPTKQPSSEFPWPVINLSKLPKIKQRLDIKERENIVIERGPSLSTKVPKPDSGTSSSSESEDDQEAKVKVPQQTTSPIKPPIAVKPHQDSHWPNIDLVRIPKVKQRLDIKERVSIMVSPVPERIPSTTIRSPKSDSGTSSSSESEDEREIKVKVEQEKLQQTISPIKPPIAVKPPPESQWPVIDLVKIPQVKRRLDIKTTMPSSESSSSDSENERTQARPNIVSSSSIKVSKPESGTSSSSESDDENKVPSTKVTSPKPELNIGSRVELQTEWPVVDLRGITRINRRLDFKISSQAPTLSTTSRWEPHSTIAKDHSSSSSSSDEEEGPTVRPSLKKSSSSSDDESNKPKFPTTSVTSQERKDFFKVSPNLGITRGPTKTSPNIELEKYKVSDDLRGKYSSGSSSPVVTPDMQSKWATMNLGHSRFRKRLDITKTSHPSFPPPNPPRQDEIITGLDMPDAKRIIVTEHASPLTKEQNVDTSSSSSESDDDLKVNLKSSVKKKSSSSSSEEETLKAAVPDLSAGIPRLKKRLDIKGPTPPPSSSSSDDEKVYAHKFSDVTDQRSIEYKRTIMKSFSHDSPASNMQWQTHRELSYVGKDSGNPKKLSLDNIKRKLLPSKQNELPPNLRWTSVGTNLSEHPLPIPRRQQVGYTSPPPMSSPPPRPKQDSSDSSSSDEEEKEVETALVVTQTTYNPKNVTFNTSPMKLKAVNFEERPERKGLSALKAMSSHRKNWESENEIVTESAPVSVDHPPEFQTAYQRTVNTKKKISQAQSYSFSTSSPATEDRRLADMTYGIPSYRRHIITSTDTPEDLPPPVPSTPLPEESIDYTWRSPQSSLSRGNMGYSKNQRKTTVEQSVDDPFYDNPNISSV